METIFSFLRFATAAFCMLILVFLVLLALPKSRLRAVFLITTGWILKVTAVLCFLYVVSPLDLVPDFVPGIGLLDDILVGAFGVLSGIGGIGSSAAGRRETHWLKENEYRLEEDGEAF